MSNSHLQPTWLPQTVQHGSSLDGIGERLQPRPALYNSQHNWAYFVSSKRVYTPPVRYCTGFEAEAVWTYKMRCVMTKAASQWLMEVDDVEASDCMISPKPFQLLEAKRNSRRLFTTKTHSRIGQDSMLEPNMLSVLACRDCHMRVLRKRGTSCHLNCIETWQTGRCARFTHVILACVPYSLCSFLWNWSTSCPLYIQQLYDEGS